MAKSMTGFGRCIAADDTAKISVEIRSVNHRYLDLNLKLNHRLLSFENKIRNILQQNIARGKVDVNINYHPVGMNCEDVVYNRALANLYKESISKISEEFNLSNDLSATRLATMRDVLTIEESPIDEDLIWARLMTCLNDALNSFVDQRKEEGQRLLDNVLSKVSDLFDLVSHIENSSEDIVDKYKQKLLDKIKEAVDEKEIDESRLATELVIYADKICIDEEIVRLRSHIESFRKTLLSEGEIGRKLDFISQELNREANTILSKTQDPSLSNIGIEIKTLIEKIREQIQNIE